MLNRIVKYSLDNRLVVIIASLLLTFGGVYVSQRMDVDVFPNLNAPTVVIMTEAHGMAPEEVEKMVSFPLESVMNGANNIRRVRSSSSMGFSIIWAEFDWGVDIYDARQTINERLVQAAEKLPKGIGKPVIAPQSSLMGEIMILAITSDTLSPMELRTRAEWIIRPRLLAVGGVAQVTIIGGEMKEYQILADPLKMKHFQVSMDELLASCEASNSNVPGGFFAEYGNQYIVRGVSRTTDVKDIGKTLIKMIGETPVLISDVAKVKIGCSPKFGSGSFEAQDAVVITITKQPNINTIKLSEKIKTELASIQNSNHGLLLIHSNIFDQSEFITYSVKNVQRALIEGAILVIIILFIFLMNVRTTLISVIALPLSLLTGIIALHLLGITINTMTLGGMTIAIGSLVDDAIIDVENVYKRLREKAASGIEINYLKVVYDASLEIRSSILNATLIIIVAFVPLFFLSGMEGLMLQPLGIAYIVSLAASLLVAMTITPVLCSLLLTNKKSLTKTQEGSLVERILRKGYRYSLERALFLKRTILLVSVLLLLGAVSLLLGFGNNFLPPLNEGAMTINLSIMPGSSLEESEKYAQTAQQTLLEIPEVQTVASRTGRAELAEHTFGVNISELDVPYVLNHRSKEEFLEEVRHRLHRIPGVNVEVGQPITHRINHMLSGSKSQIAIKLFGTSLSEMYMKAQEIKAAIEDIPGIADLNVEQQVEIPQIKIRPKREMLAKYGITINELNHFIKTGLNGVKVSDVFENEKSFDLTLRLNDSSRNHIRAIEDVLISSSGGMIPLSYVTEITSSSGPNTINRENVKRKMVISVNVSDRDAGSVVADIKGRMNDISLPEDSHIEYGGQFQSAEETTRRLAFTSLLALLIIFVILYQEFKNAKLAGIILLNLPLALIGGIAAIWFTSSTMSIPAVIGFITLFGIATRNGILLVSRYEALLKEGKSLQEAILSGSSDRLNPILMTALTAALALIPLILYADKPGNEIQSPMAVVILGGLLSSTLLNIYVIPIVYQWIKRKNYA